MPSDLSAPTDAEDPLVTEHVEHALAPYRGLLPPEDLEGFREMLVVFYSAHPIAAGLLDELRAPPFVESSGKVARKDDAALEEASAHPRKLARGRE